MVLKGKQLHTFIFFQLTGFHDFNLIAVKNRGKEKNKVILT